jgi:hypothetical protein
MTPERLREIIQSLERAVTTATNDDESYPGTSARRRHVERIDAMKAAIEFLRSDGANQIQSDEYTDPNSGETYTAKKLAELLNGRDDFIGSRGLWDDFVASLPRAPSKLLPSEAKQGAEPVAPPPGWKYAYDKSRRTIIMIPTGAKIDPAGLYQEAVARAICESQGYDPDELAPIGEMCTADNKPVQYWRVYEEQAEAAILSLLGGAR